MTIKRHKHRRPPQELMGKLTRSQVTKKGSSDRRLIAGIIVFHKPPQHKREYTFHATKGWRSSQ